MSGAVRIIERDRSDLLGEGPVWSAREGALLWVDILGRKVQRLSLDDETVTVWTLPEMIGWVIERASAPGFIAGFASGFAELTLEPLRIEPIVDPEPDRPQNRLNDAKADHCGRIWAGSMPVAANEPSGCLYCMDVDRAVTRVDSGYTVANGPALSPDGTILYHTDSARRVIYRFRLHEDGTLSDRAPFIEFESSWGQPDGMTVDRDGGLWVAHYGASCVSRFHDDGRRDRSIALPASQITSCTFAGEGLDRMFVTSAADGAEHEQHAGALFEVEPNAQGLAPHRFGG
ncbi:MAG TPA: SMP-30/gluconolactonase/LRE family protein [Steroidobacteraceae bacterium]|nr:SMP-30/gluconolactonase/LRE family protein [Steroidobacteraceae bacterium]